LRGACGRLPIPKSRGNAAAHVSDADTSAASGVIFHPASGVDERVAIQAQATLRRRVLRAFVGRGLLQSFEAKEMLAYRHSGFSGGAGVCIAAHERAGLERLPRSRALG